MFFLQAMFDYHGGHPGLYHFCGLCLLFATFIDTICPPTSLFDQFLISGFQSHGGSWGGTPKSSTPQE